jgi:hypothetical protein
MGTLTVTRHSNTPDDIPDLEFKEDKITGFHVVDEDQGIVEAFVSITGIEDKVKDVIEPGAYAKTLQVRKPRGILDHDWKQPASKALEVKELLPGDPNLPKTLADGTPWPDEAGALYVRAQYNLDTQRGRDLFSDAKFYGDEQQWSIGYNVPAGESYKKDGKRFIKSLELYEYSTVLWGAMPHARTLAVKSEEAAAETKDGDGADDTKVAKPKRPARSRANGEQDTLDIDPDMDDDDVADDYDDDESLPHMREGNKKDALANAELAIKGFASMLRASGYTDAAIAELAGLDIKALDGAEPADDPADGYGTFGEAVDDIAAEVLSGKELESLKELADAFDYTQAGLLDDKALSDAENDVVAFLRDMTTKEDNHQAVYDMASVLAAMTDEGTESKRFFSADQRSELASSGAAMPDGSFPIKNEKDLKNAIRLVGRAKNPDEAKAHIIKRAKALNLTDDLPDDWKDDTKADTVKIDLSEFEGFLIRDTSV